MASSRDTRKRKRRRRGILRQATAGVVPVALAGSAQAIPVAIEFPVPITLSSGQTLPLDLNQDGVDDIAIAVSAGGPISISLDFLAPQTGAVPDRLDAGTSVGPASSFSLVGFDLLAGLPGGPVSGTWSVAPPQPPIIDGFLGVAAPPQPPFVPPQPPFYGWVHLSLDLENASATVDRFGYETEPGVPILTAVPEPASASLLAFGLAFLRRFTAVRRKRK